MRRGQLLCFAVAGLPAASGGREAEECAGPVRLPAQPEAAGAQPESSRGEAERHHDAPRREPSSRIVRSKKKDRVEISPHLTGASILPGETFSASRLSLPAFGDAA